jgi:predicted MFS family arabinose efflux permease
MVKRPWIVLLCGTINVTLTMGVRQSFGLYLPQMGAALAIGRGEFGLALAIQNLLFGLAQPFVGALADRHGAGRVIVLGALLYAAGLAAASFATNAIGLHLSLGAAIGVALAATTFVVVLGVVGRIVPAQHRSASFGIVTAGGSLGQFLLVPVGQMMLVEVGYRMALIVMAGVIALCIPLAFGLAGSPARTDGPSEPVVSLSDALKEASQHSGYWLLNAGFLVCGFHVAFIAAHFPAYLNDHGLGLSIGATALALIGLFNIVGSYIFGVSGDRLRKKWLLSAIYGARAVVMLGFLAVPLSSTTALVFASAMGFLWLGTVPLTSGIVGQIFGMRYLSTLYGIVFLSHQVGSFFGAWMAGYLYDRLGNYDATWAASVVLALLAMILHLPIKDASLRQPEPA